MDIHEKNIKDYEKIVGPEIINLIQKKVNQLSGKHIVCVSSTSTGGGVAEILNAAIPLLNDMGLEFGWRIAHGSSDFFSVTKKFHNALQGEEIELSDRKKEIYYETNHRFSKFTHLADHDLVMVHDPQPLALIDFYPKRCPWIFRCHIDISEPNHEIFDYLKTFINKYDHVVVSKKEYLKKTLTPHQSIIYPAIDPLSDKNQDIPKQTIERYLKKYKIDTTRPFIAQVSRFDKWKDPVGVIKIFENVRKKKNCQLVLLGNMAPDDPEGQALYEEITCRAASSRYAKDIKVILGSSDILVNCVQRSAAVIIQKSLKEGFGLTVSEALFKETPVVASRVGGISLQVIDGVNGFLCEPKDIKGFSEKILKLLLDPVLREEFGKNGREHTIENFLITRLILDWLELFNYYLGLEGYRPLLENIKDQIITELNPLPKKTKEK